MGGDFENYKGARVAIATYPPGPVRHCPNGLLAAGAVRRKYFPTKVLVEKGLVSI